jgi:hypothetical protein
VPINRPIEECGYTSWPHTLYRTPSKFSGRYIARHRKKYGGRPWVESPNTPDEPGVLDAGDAVEGLGVCDWRRVCRVRWLVWWFLAVSGDEDLSMDEMN